MTQKVREVIADYLGNSGTKMVFALMGATNQKLMCDLGERLKIRLIHCRHEAGAVGMADGYARFSEQKGVATVTAGPGVTNTATSLAVAHYHRSRVLLLAGDLPDNDQRNPQRFEQDAFSRLCAGNSTRIEDPARIYEALHAVDNALADDRPFVLHLPLNIQEMHAPANESGHELRDTPTSPGPVPHAIESELAKAAALLCKAQRPAVLAGRGALGSRRQLIELARLVGAPLMTTLRAAGLFAGESLEAGIAGAIGDGRAEAVLEKTDFLLAVGTSLHPFTISAFIKRSNLPDIVRIDSSDPLDDENLCRVDIRAEASVGIQKLLEQSVKFRHSVPVTPWQYDNAHFLLDRYFEPEFEKRTKNALNPLDVLGAVRELLPKQRLLVIGGGHSSLSACQMLPASGPHDFTCVSTDFAAIGQALAVAIGACFARPGERVFHVTADGELLMALAELHTAIRYQLSLTIIILNDHGFGQERHSLAHAGHPVHYATHPSPDFATLAEALGAQSYSITKPAELALLKSAFNHQQGVVVVDISIDPDFLNPASQHVAAVMAQHASPVTGKIN